MTATPTQKETLDSKKDDRTIRVFISSTFRDMHAERDHLVTVVFPELRERIERLGLEFFDVDLRWGVPEKNADNEKANSWEYCKQWIDRVEPFFICMLGQRYGWTPGPAEIKDENDRELYEGLSVTEMEIRHAVLTRKLSRRSYFYFRETLVPKDADKEVYSEFVDVDHEEQLDSLKKDILAHSNRPVRYYDCNWSGKGFSGLDKGEKEKQFGKMVLEDLWSGILRDERFVDKKFWRDAGIDPETDSLYINESVPIPEDIWEKIVDHAKPEPKDPLDAEREQMDAFADKRLNWFEGRKTEIEQLTDFISVTNSNAPRLAVVAAVPGQGKSALLAKLNQQLQSSPYFVITHFVGATERSANAYELVKRLLGELDRSGIIWQEAEEKEPKLDFNSLSLKLAQRLGDYAGDRRIVILIDALNQLTDGHDLQWLPYRLGPGVRLIVSCVDDENAKPDGAEQKVLNALTSRKPAPFWVPLDPLTEYDVRTIVISYLKEYCHELDDEYLDIICSITQARNPLYLLVMLNELRTLSGNDLNSLVPSLIASMPKDHPDTVSLFRWVLQRMEVFGKQRVQWWCLYLAHGRIGMSSKELSELLAIRLDPEAATTALLIERGMRRYLQRRGPQLDFFHGQLRQAVLEQYGSGIDSNMVNADLANYFIDIADPEKNQSWKGESPRPFLEIIFHLIYAQRIDNFCEKLCDLRFIEARCRVGQVFELIADYQQAKNKLPEAEEELFKEQAQQERLQRWTREIIEYARQWSERRDSAAKGEAVNELEPQLPEPPETCRMWTEEKIEAACQRIIKNPTRLDRLEAFGGFVESQCYPLVEFGKYVGFVAQHAYGYAPVGQVHDSGETQLSDLRTPYILRRWTAGTKYSPRPACLRTLEGHTDEVSSISVISDGWRAITAGNYKDKTLRVWNLKSGICLQILEGHNSWINCVCITPDGKRAVSCGSDKTIRVWDVDSGSCLRILEGSSNTVDVTPDGRLAISEGWGTTVRVWDLEHGVCVQTLAGHSESVNCVRITPDGRRAVSGGADDRLCVWDLEKGICSRKLEVHSDVKSVDVTPDGLRAVSHSTDNSLRVWDLESGVCLWAMGCDNNAISYPHSVSMTPDGRLAISGTWWDDTLRVWDIENGACLRILEGRCGRIFCVSITPDGRRAMSGSFDKTFRVWNLESGMSSERMEGHAETVNCVCITPDGRSVVSGSSDKTLRTWDLKTGACLRSLDGHTNKVSCVSITPNSRQAVSGSSDTTLCIWDLKEAPLLRIFKKGFLRVLIGHADNVSGVKVTPDGLFAVSGSWDDTVRVWDMKSKTCRGRLNGQSHWIISMEMTPNGQSVVVTGISDSMLRVLDLQTGDCQRTMKGHSEYVESMSITPDGRHLMSGSRDKTVRVWDIESGECLQILEGHNDNILSLNVTSDGRYAVSGSWDKTLRVWDLYSGSNLLVFRTDTPVHTAAIFSDKLVVGLRTGEVLFAEIHNIPIGPAIITALNSKQARCTMCGKAFALPPTVVNAIRNKNAAGLSANCPQCDHTLLFNPFFASREA